MNPSNPLLPASPLHVTVGACAASGPGTLILLALKSARRAKGKDGLEIRGQACVGHPGCGIWGFTSELQITFNKIVVCLLRTANWEATKLIWELIGSRFDYPRPPSLH